MCLLLRRSSPARCQSDPPCQSAGSFKKLLLKSLIIRSSFADYSMIVDSDCCDILNVFGLKKRVILAALCFVHHFFQGSDQLQ
jgi:hypothetical protein